MKRLQLAQRVANVAFGEFRRVCALTFVLETARCGQTEKGPELLPLRRVPGPGLQKRVVIVVPGSLSLQADR